MNSSFSDKRTIILEQKAFQDGIGAPTEQPSPHNPVGMPAELQPEHG
uniref:TUBGCP4 n=1 Tax=Arundo donax TaxID=35708 RepID=A0A0A9CN17_ARUDO